MTFNKLSMKLAVFDSILLIKGLVKSFKVDTSLILGNSGNGTFTNIL